MAFFYFFFMNICRLCKEKEATQLNSHIITWALIKDAVNQPGYKDRDYDVTFSITASKKPELYIGRSVSPEHIKKVTGDRLLWNEENEGNINPLTRDNIFCRQCE